jgi:hypothetical protein
MKWSGDAANIVWGQECVMREWINVELMIDEPVAKNKYTVKEWRKCARVSLIAGRIFCGSE